MARKCALRSDVEAGEVSVVLEAGGEDRRERDLIERRNPQGVEDRTAIERSYLTACRHRAGGKKKCGHCEEATRASPP